MTPDPGRRLLVLGVAAGWLAPGAGATASPASGTPLLVSAASSLGEALREIARDFEAAHPGVPVRLNLGASGALLQQAARGAPVDVLVAADEQTLRQAVAQRLVDPAGVVPVARNALVLVVPAAVPAADRPVRLAQLARPAFARVALGHPGSVPAGRYAQGALQAAGLWEALQPRVVGAANVRQVLDYVARGEVDAGFVYATDAAAQPGKVAVAIAVATATPIVYPAASLRAAPQPALAARFVQHLAAPGAQAVLARHGFAPP